MSKADLTHLYERVNAALHAKGGDAGTSVESVEVKRYLSSEIADEEAKLLRRYPQPVAASSELPTSGAWLAGNRFNTPFLLVRQHDGRVHAYLNVCRHRGARVVAEGSGLQARAFACPYHGWTYDLDGSLRGIPQASGFPCMDNAESGLRRLAATERAGMIWVVCDPSLSGWDPNESLGALMDELESLDGMRSPAAFAPRSYAVAANWKLLIDGSFEAYHFKVAHKKTIASMFTDNMQLVDEFGLNRRLYLPKSKFAEERPTFDAFNPRKYGNLIYFFFPNTLFLVQPDHSQVSCFEPTNAAAVRVHEVALIPEVPASDKAHGHWQANVDLYRRTVAEDYALSESIQAGLASGANSELRFGTYEFSAARFHTQLDRCMRGGH